MIIKQRDNNKAVKNAFYKIISLANGLPQDSSQKIILALLSYAYSDCDIDMSPQEYCIWLFIKEQLDNAFVEKKAKKTARSKKTAKTTKNEGNDEKHAKNAKIVEIDEKHAKNAKIVEIDEKHAKNGEKGATQGADKGAERCAAESKDAQKTDSKAEIADNPATQTGDSPTGQDNRHELSKQPGDTFPSRTRDIGTDKNISTDKKEEYQKIERERGKRENENSGSVEPPEEQPTPDSVEPTTPDSVEPPAPAAETNDLQKARDFVDYFNSILASAKSVIPHQCKLTEQRRKAIGARSREYGEDALRTVVCKARDSAFLNGRNQRAWTATLDWLLRPNNFPKVLEGNYDDKTISDDGNKDRKAVIDPRRGTEAVEHDSNEYL